MKRIFSGVLVAVSLLQLPAQELYMPRNIKKLTKKEHVIFPERLVKITGRIKECIM